MPELKSKCIKRILSRGKYIKLPEAVIEENTLSRGTPVEVHYGSNYNCVVILPQNTKISDRTKERLNILLNESLETKS